MKILTVQSRTKSGAREPKSLEFKAKAAVYPFSAIVGQDDVKLGLILNAIDPTIGGALLMGHRGTGKSTAVRALVDLLPQISRVQACLYQCSPANEQSMCSDCQRIIASGEKLRLERSSIPLVDLPLGATEDRVCGTIDIERALNQGAKSFEPGLLARANRGFLYIDEVNLLDDHLVDLLLDVSATGRNKVEREGISIEHPSRFVLIGSGNPEEGELRPQLLDRFGLHVEVKTEDDPDARVEIVERRQTFDNNPVQFCKEFAGEQKQLQTRITRAQKNLSKVKVDRKLMRQIAELCSRLKIDGHRGELTIVRSARALAALDGRMKVSEEDVRRVTVMALQHRLRRDPLEDVAGAEQIQRALDSVLTKNTDKRGGGSKPDGSNGSYTTPGNLEGGHISGSSVRRRSAGPRGEVGEDSPSVQSVTSVPDLGLSYLDDTNRATIIPRRSRTGSDVASNRARSGRKRTSLNFERGRYAKALSARNGAARIALGATIRAMAGITNLTSAVDRTADKRCPFVSDSLRYQQLSRKKGTLFILLIDASGSMARNRIALAKAAAVSLLKDSYIKRDRVAIVGFRGTSAEILLPPSKSMLRARRVLDSLGVGGGTPLSAGLLCSLNLAKRNQDIERELVLLIFTDGRANVSLRTSHNGDRNVQRMKLESEAVSVGRELGRAGVRVTVVDTQNDFVSVGNAKKLADKLNGSYVSNQELLTSIARSATLGNHAG